MGTARERWEFDPALAREELARRFNLASLDGLGLGPDDDPAIGAAGALLRYLSELQPGGFKHLARPTVRRADGHLWLDEMTRRNLELVEPLRAGARGVTLLETIDATVTPMGARLLRAWLLSPLSDPARIEERLDAVDALVQDTRGRARLREALEGVRDIERLAGRAAAGRATPRELAGLRDSFLRLPDVLEGLRGLSQRGTQQRTRRRRRDLRPPGGPGPAAGRCARGPAAGRPGRRRRHPPRATTRNSTRAATSATAGSSTSPRCSSGSGNAPASRRSRWATTRSSGITWR